MDSFEFCSIYISLLIMLHKVLETVIFKGLTSFLKKNEVLYEYQSGFRPDCSTIHGLTDVLEYI